MNWTINFLVRVLGAFLTSYGLVGITKLITNVVSQTTTEWTIVFLTAGLALLFAPEIKNK